MFSGIIEEAGVIQSFTISTDTKRLIVTVTTDHSDTALGDSIAVNGVCLTVVEKSKTTLAFDVAEETLRRTTLGSLVAGNRVNLERSLAVGDSISGHFVFGHVDTTAVLREKISEGVNTRMVWEIAPEYMRYIAPKGSISIAGVSLTIGEVTERSFSVYIIPHTFEKTNLATLTIGEHANIEVDMLARYVVNAMETLGGRS